MLRIAEAARDLSLHDVAVTAAEHALGLDPKSRLRAPLFLADMACKAGRQEAAFHRPNSGEEESRDPDQALRAAGVAPRQANILLDRRPFADLGGVAATPFIGRKTMESLKAASVAP